jgi:hypothetical protein
MRLTSISVVMHRTPVAMLATRDTAIDAERE